MNGTLTEGDGRAAGFVAAVADELAAELGFDPFHGTLNLLTDAAPPGATIRLDAFVDDHCDGLELSPCRLAGLRGAVLRPLVADYPADKVEVVAPVELRAVLAIEPGDDLRLTTADAVWPPSVRTADPDALGAFEAVVFDLDDTLLELGVDWERVVADIETLFGPVLEEPVRAYDEPQLLDLAREHGLYDDLERLLRDAEVAGADRSTRLPALDALHELSCPVGICTANSVPAAKRALESFDALGAVDAVVGRESVAASKPDPRPLQACLDRLEATPGNALFVGDAEADAGAAAGAGTSFLHPEQLWPDG